MRRVFLAALLAGASSAPAQAEVLLGGQLAVTAETVDGESIVALNVLPLVAEWAATPRVGARATTVLNLRLGGDGPALAHRGGGLTVPVYLGAAEERPRQGFYLGPHVSLASNPILGGVDRTLAGEGGVRWEVAPGWSLNLAAQLGVTVLGDGGGRRSVSHFGVFPSIGAWVF